MSLSNLATLIIDEKMSNDKDFWPIERKEIGIIEFLDDSNDENQWTILKLYIWNVDSFVSYSTNWSCGIIAEFLFIVFITYEF